MIEGLPSLADAGPGVFVGLIIVLILTGRLVPYWQVKAKDRRIEYLEAANTELVQAVSGIREPLETNNALIRSVVDRTEDKP